MDDKPASPIIIQSNPFPQPKNLIPPGLTKSLPKFIFIALSFVIVGELIWGGYTLFGLGKGNNIRKIHSTVAASTPPSAKITLSSGDLNLVVGEVMVVDVELDTNDRASAGTDLIIKYNPQFLSLEGAGQEVFTSANLYGEYLGLVVDKEKGIFAISGISSAGEFINKDGKFGSLRFKALKVGSTNITVDFQKGSTIDSNVIDAKLNQDVLDSVSNLEVKIN